MPDLNRSVFMIQFKVEAFSTKDARGRRRYTKSCSIIWSLGELSLFTMANARRQLSKHITWGSAQWPNFFFYDKNCGEDACLHEDSQVPYLVDMYKDKKHCVIVVAVLDTHGMIVEHEPQDEQLNSDDMPAPSQPGPLLDPFDSNEDYVGVDDEHIYMGKSKADHIERENECQPEVAADENQHTTFVHMDAADIEEVGIQDADPDELIFAHDPDNPCIRKKEKFADMLSFRKALRHHAIINGFEIRTYKSDTTRFIGICNYETCPWRIHASKMPDGVSIMVCHHTIALSFMCEFTCFIALTQCICHVIADQDTDRRAHLPNNKACGREDGVSVLDC